MDSKLADRLEQLTNRLREELDGQLGGEDVSLLREAVATLRTPDRVEVVEQSTLSRTVRVPDGWSWTDIGPFTGYYSGIRLQKGEPVIEQDGHQLWLRQGETSFTERQVDIYKKASQMSLRDANGVFHPAKTVMVVHGFQGAREGYTIFKGGEQLPTRFTDARGIVDYVRNWLQEAHEHPIIPRKQPPRQPPPPRLV